MHQETDPLRSSAVEDYTKAIYALEELIARKLGDPTRDPHGDPIPTRDLEIEQTVTQSLESLQAGDCGTFAWMSDADPEMLRYLAARGIASGDELEVSR